MAQIDRQTNKQTDRADSWRNWPRGLIRYKLYHFFKKTKKTYIFWRWQKLSPWLNVNKTSVWKTLIREILSLLINVDQSTDTKKNLFLMGPNERFCKTPVMPPVGFWNLALGSTPCLQRLQETLQGNSQRMILLWLSHNMGHFFFKEPFWQSVSGTLFGTKFPHAKKAPNKKGSCLNVPLCF